MGQVAWVAYRPGRCYQYTYLQYFVNRKVEQGYSIDQGLWRPQCPIVVVVSVENWITPQNAPSVYFHPEIHIWALYDHLFTCKRYGRMPPARRPGVALAGLRRGAR